MIATVILAVSIILQLVAAFLALRLIRVTGKRIAWVLIATAVVLMAARRGISLFEFLAVEPAKYPNIYAELVALAISGFMAVGLALISPIFEDLKSMGEALRKREQEFRALAERLDKIASQVPGVIYQFRLRPDGSSCFPYASAGMRQIYRLAPDEVREDAAKVFAVLHPEDYAAVVESINASARTLCHWQHEYRVRYADGVERWLLGNSVPEREPDGSVIWHGFITDITERIKAEDELRKHREHLAELVAERTAALQAANGELEAFSYSVSHDLRTPLRAIDGFSRMLADKYAGELGAEAQRLIRVVRDNSARMSQLIDDILAFSRSGRVEMRQAEVDMEQLVQSVWLELEPLRGERRIDFELKPLQPARGDPAMLRQVWHNLLANAIKFTAHQALARIEVSGMVEGADSLYAVRDNGAGFDPAYAHKLFGVFQRLHGVDEFEGTGIGLAIVKRIVARHGGQVMAEGQVGVGATFRFTLPIKAC